MWKATRMGGHTSSAECAVTGHSDGVLGSADAARSAWCSVESAMGISGGAP
jgi:hypothetical protein